MGAGDVPSTSLSLLGQLADPTNERAWTTFAGRYRPLIDRWCRQKGLQPADAEWVSNGILFKLYRALAASRYDPAHRFRSWLKAVVENAVRDFWRDRERRPAAVGSGDPNIQKTLEQIATPDEVEGLAQVLNDTLARDQEQALEVIARVQARVEPHSWQAFCLTALHGQPAKEVATQLGISTGAVYQAKKRIGDMLRAEGLDLKSRDPGAGEGPL
jgi:RNA polymerase sigma-70 factor (ECF subfamily)